MRHVSLRGHGFFFRQLQFFSGSSFAGLKILLLCRLMILFMFSHATIAHFYVASIENLV